MLNQMFCCKCSLQKWSINHTITRACEQTQKPWKTTVKWNSLFEETGTWTGLYTAVTSMSPEFVLRIHLSFNTTATMSRDQ